MNILILEDEEDVARAYRRILQSQGHELQVTRDVGTAIDVLETSKDPFHMLVVDHRLAGGERGDSLLEFAKTHFPDALRVLVSGVAEPDGTDDDPPHQIFLRKPLGRDALLDLVERALQHKARVSTV